MKFAHLADCHVGAWREPRMRELTIQAFEYAIDTSIAERVDFVLIAGDLFHTAIPSLDGVKAVFKSLSKLRSEGIPLYFICGSHDYSPTGKTMLDIIEEAGLGTNLFRGTVHDGVLTLKWTVDPKTGVRLTGILGRANQLDSAIYKQVDRVAAEQEPGEKIFLFHTSLAELKPKGMVFDSAPVSLLPKGCKYYAGGHVHTRTDAVIEGRHIAYPGPLFPASFSELEDLRYGTFCIVDDWKVHHVPVEVKPVVNITLDCDNCAPAHVPQTVLEQLPANVRDAIVLVRAKGTLAGKPSDIPWRALHDELASRGAFIVLRNTVELASPQMEKSMVSVGTLSEIEERVISEHKVDKEFVLQLMSALSQEQQDGEKKAAYEERIMSTANATVKGWSARRD
jgi:DNA repair protein SbcD/Mre11